MTLAGNDVILTGVPRSGTTLTCSLLNKLPDTVALHEPMQKIDPGDVTQPRHMCLGIRDFFDEQRRSIHERGVARSRNIDGAVPDNPFPSVPSRKGVREQIDVLGEITIDKPLTDQFMLVIKHTSRFAPMIQALSEFFPVYAIIRNPLASLASWGTVDAGIQRGRTGPAGLIDAAMKTRVEQNESTLDRQIVLLDWYFEQFLKWLPPAAIIRYEEIVATGGRALSVITPEAGRLSEPLVSRNLNTVYSRQRMQHLGKRLLQTDGAMWEFYPRASVEALLREAEQAPAS